MERSTRLFKKQSPEIQLYAAAALVENEEEEEREEDEACDSETIAKLFKDKRPLMQIRYEALVHHHVGAIKAEGLKRLRQSVFLRMWDGPRNCLSIQNIQTTTYSLRNAFVWANKSDLIPAQDLVSKLHSSFYEALSRFACVSIAVVEHKLTDLVPDLMPTEECRKFASSTADPPGGENGTDLDRMVAAFQGYHRAQVAATRGIKKVFQEQKIYEEQARKSARIAIGHRDPNLHIQHTTRICGIRVRILTLITTLTLTPIGR